MLHYSPVMSGPYVMTQSYHRRLDMSAVLFFLLFIIKATKALWVAHPTSRLSFRRRCPAAGSTVGRPKRPSSVNAVAVEAESTGRPSLAFAGSINGSDGICTHAERIRTSVFVRSNVRAAARMRSPGMRATAAFPLCVHRPQLFF